MVTQTISGMKKQISKLKAENRAWKETCEILADKKLLREMAASLKEIRKGKYLRPSDL